MNIRKQEPNLSWSVVMSQIDLVSILASYHPEGEEKFVKEYDDTVK